jgi:hypothetical protein
MNTAFSMAEVRKMAAAIQAENPDARRVGIIRLGEGQYMIRSKSNPATGHIVTRNADYSWTCDCKAAMYRGRCRHISTARAYETAIECGYNSPDCETIEYYRLIEDGKEERARRGIPIEPP